MNGKVEVGTPPNNHLTTPQFTTFTHNRPLNALYSIIINDLEIMINKIVRIAKGNDNENYIPYRDMDLIITEKHFCFDDEPIYDLDIVDSNIEFPFSLYEWEFE